MLVSLTLARGEVPVCVGLRLVLPPAWVDDAERRQRAHVPSDVVARPKWQIALDERDRVRAAGARFGGVVADAEYGKAAAFRQGLQDREVRWAVGILPTQKVYPADVTLTVAPAKGTGRPPKHPLPSVESRSGADTIAALPEVVSLGWLEIGGQRDLLSWEFNNRRFGDRRRRSRHGTEYSQ